MCVVSCDIDVGINLSSAGLTWLWKPSSLKKTWCSCMTLAYASTISGSESYLEILL